MTTPHENQPNPDNSSIDWMQLETQLDGTEERIEAIQQGDLDRSAHEIRQMLARALPGAIEAIEQSDAEPVFVSELEIAEDGNPIISSLDEAYALAHERPGLAETMARTAERFTSVDRQQLEIDLKRANATGDQDEVERLQKDAGNLQEKTDKIEFFAAVAELHPFTKRFETESNLPVIHHIGSHDDRVRCLVWMSDELSRMVETSRNYGPGNFEAYRREKGTDERTERWIKGMTKHVEENAVKIALYKQFMGAVIEGRAEITIADLPRKIYPHIPKEETRSPQEIAQVQNGVDIVKSLPGTDPVLLTIDNRLNEFPESGWVITADITPGKSGKVVATQYKDGGMRARWLTGDPEDEQKHLALGFKTKEADEVKVVYTDAAHAAITNANGGQLSESDDRIHLSDDKLLGVTRDPMRLMSNDTTMSMYADWMDIDRFQTRSPGSLIQVSRITDNPNQAVEIVKGLGTAMGLKNEELETFASAFTNKDTFKPLRFETAAEKAERRARYLRENPPIEAEDDYESYSDY